MKINNNRTENAKLNSIITVLTQVIQIVLGFLIRKLFIRYLGMEYLGYNSVFSNILQMLNLADLGIGVAITSYLYKPLAEDDKERIASLMVIYQKFYIVIGATVLVIGLIISIFLKELIPDATCSIGYLRVLFYINLVGTVSTYFLAYKRTLFVADQKSYITNLNDTIVNFAVSGLQIASLVLHPNYIIYLMLNIMKNIASNIILSVKSNNLYGDFKKNANKQIIEQYNPKIKQYIKDVFISRIGAVVYYSTDNVILSVMKGSLITGYLSNYTLITSQLNTIVVQVLGSLQGSFGNYIASSKDKDSQRLMTDNYFCVNFCFGNFCFICFTLLAQPFICLFFGENMLLSFSTAALLGLNLMLTFLIQLPSQVFTIYKLFNYDKPIIVISATLNFVISVLLVNQIGVNGVLIGTTITSLIYLFSRFFIISKYVYDVNYIYYIRQFIRYFLICYFSFTITYYATRDLSVSGFISFFIKTIFVVLISILSTSTLLSPTKEFKFLLNKLVPNKLCKYIKQSTIIVACIFLMIASILVGAGNTK